MEVSDDSFEARQDHEIGLMNIGVQLAKLVDLEFKVFDRVCCHLF